MSLLYTVRLKVLKVMRESAKGHDQGHLISTQLPEIVQLVDQASDMVRDTSHKLHPIMLNESDGLSIVLREAVREFRERSGVATQVSVEGAGIALPLELANATFRVVEEALRNIEKHAQAHQVWLEMSVSLSDGLDLRLRDDGIGFSTSQYTRSSGRQKGLGMTNMHQRIQKNGGRLVVSSSQVPGESGTVLTIHFSGARLMQKDSA